MTVSNVIKASQLFTKACDLGYALGWRNVKDMPGCQEHQLDKDWWFAINPHPETTKCSNGMPVPAYSVYYEYNGWPFGLVNIVNGWAGSGSLANEDALIAVLNKAIQAAEQNI